VIGSNPRRTRGLSTPSSSSSNKIASRRLRRAVLATPAVAALFGFGSAARAANYYWDADAQGNPGGGSGNWNQTDPRWSLSPVAGPYITWPNTGTDDANFGSSGGLVTAESPITVNSLHYAGGEWAMQNLSTGSLALSTNAVIETANGSNVFMLSPFTGSGFVKRGSGTLALYLGNSFFPPG